MAEGNWFVHAGYTSVAAFEGLFLPLQPELVVGGGYRYPLTDEFLDHGFILLYRVHASDLLGRSGPIGDVRYRYSPREDFWFTHGLGHQPWHRRRGKAPLQNRPGHDRGPGAVHAAGVCVFGR